MSSLLGVAAVAAGVCGETEDEQKLRFQVELEFVQCLANPNYLNFLAQRDYFKNPTFINYLKYLLYWKRSEYAKFLKYPQALTLSGTASKREIPRGRGQRSKHEIHRRSDDLAMAILRPETNASSNVASRGRRRGSATRSSTSSASSQSMITRSTSMTTISPITFVIIGVIFFSFNICGSLGDSVDSWVELPTKCETCKYVAKELLNRLDETGRTSEVLLTGNTRSVLESDVKSVKKKKYRHSELRFVETLEDLCERLLNYNLHKEYKDSRRFAKGRSQTMETLHGLVEKGVKVELGIPYELWDSPSVEVTQMKAECEQMIEQYEDDLQSWYFYDDDDPKREPLIKYLCEDRALKGGDQACLKEDEDATKKVDGPDSKLKGQKGDRGEL